MFTSERRLAQAVTQVWVVAVFFRVQVLGKRCQETTVAGAEVGVIF